jgi:hypothetical protein
MLGRFSAEASRVGHPNLVVQIACVHQKRACHFPSAPRDATLEAAKVREHLTEREPQA